MIDFPWFYFFTLFTAGMAGVGLIFLKVSHKSIGVRYLLAFSAAYLLGICLLHLMPELFHSEIANPGWYILAGFLLQIILDFFSHGVEHGHAHIHEHVGTKFLFTVMVSLWIHAFIEGMPFGSAFSSTLHSHAHHHDHIHSIASGDHRESLIVGIGIHKITEGIVFTALLLSIGLSRFRAIAWAVLFSLMAPFGAAFQYVLGNTGVVDLQDFTPKIIGILIGILLHVSTIIIFESSEGHHFNLRKFVAIILGLCGAVMASGHF